MFLCHLMFLTCIYNEKFHFKKVCLFEEPMFLSYIKHTLKLRRYPTRSFDFARIEFWGRLKTYFTGIKSRRILSKPGSPRNLFSLKWQREKRSEVSITILFYFACWKGKHQNLIGRFRGRSSPQSTKIIFKNWRKYIQVFT